MIKTRAFDARANHLNAQAKHEVPKQRGVETRRTPKISISDDTPPVPKTSKDKRDYQNQRKVVKFPAQMSYDLSCTCYLSSGVVSIAALAQHKLRQLLHDQVIPARAHARAETHTSVAGAMWAAAAAATSRPGAAQPPVRCPGAAESLTAC